MHTLTESTKITNRNVYRYLRLVAPDLRFDDLEMIYRRGGESVTFYYGKNQILKVPRNDEKRRNVLNEFRLCEHLADQDLPVAVPKPLFAQPEGLYATFERHNGPSLTQEKIENFSVDEHTDFARRIGTFLTFLHTHIYPVEVMESLEQTEDTIGVHRERAHRKIRSINEYATEAVDTAEWETDLQRFEKLEDRPTVTHCDMDLDHILNITPALKRYCVIDFADAHIADPYIDLAELSVSDETLDLILAHYHTSDSTIRDKIAFGHLCRDIHRQYKAVKKSGR